MELRCKKCKAPACHITPLNVSKGETFALSKMLGGIGLDVGPIVGLLNADAATIAEAFDVLCTFCGTVNNG